MAKGKMSVKLSPGEIFTVYLRPIHEAFLTLTKYSYPSEKRAEEVNNEDWKSNIDRKKEVKNSTVEVGVKLESHAWQFGVHLSCGLHLNKGHK